jgi:hypothetical protein
MQPWITNCVYLQTGRRDTLTSFFRSPASSAGEPASTTATRLAYLPAVVDVNKNKEEGRGLNRLNGVSLYVCVMCFFMGKAQGTAAEKKEN